MWVTHDQTRNPVIKWTVLLNGRTDNMVIQVTENPRRTSISVLTKNTTKERLTQT